jgi:hypothetical protein
MTTTKPRPSLPGTPLTRDTPRRRSHTSRSSRMVWSTSRCSRLRSDRTRCCAVSWLSTTRLVSSSRWRQSGRSAARTRFSSTRTLPRSFPANFTLRSQYSPQPVSPKERVCAPLLDCCRALLRVPSFCSPPSPPPLLLLSALARFDLCLAKGSGRSSDPDASICRPLGRSRSM